MDLKFYLNKIVKVDNIENYTLKTLLELKKCYEKLLEKSEGLDPDFPTIDFSGGQKGKKISGINKTKVDEYLGVTTDDLGPLGGYDETATEIRKHSLGGKLRDPNRGRFKKK